MLVCSREYRGAQGPILIIKAPTFINSHIVKYEWYTTFSLKIIEILKLL